MKLQIGFNRRYDPSHKSVADAVKSGVVGDAHLCNITSQDPGPRATYGYDQRVEAFGSLGMVSSDNTHQLNGTLATAAGYQRPPLENFFLERYARSFLDQWAAFADMVNNDGPSPATGAHGRASLVVATAAVQSMQENRPVTIAEVDRASETKAES